MEASTDMEAELTAQRDAAIAVTRELQKQLQQQREVVVRTIERRALTAERLRLHAEAALKRERADRASERRATGKLLGFALFGGLVGALGGWAGGLLAFLALGEPLVGFLLILPAMALGCVLGLAVAKMKLQLEAQRREDEREAHVAVEEAVATAVDADDAPLEPLEGIPSVSDQDEAATWHEQQPQPSQSWVAAGWRLTWRTAQTSVGVARGLLRGADYVVDALQPAENTDTDADGKKRR